LGRKVCNAVCSLGECASSSGTCESAPNSVSVNLKTQKHK
jgi:hypothetical protein